MELLLGMGLILIAILTLFVLFPSSEKAVRLSDDRTQALHFARRLMEQKLSLHYDQLLLQDEPVNEAFETTLRRGVRSRLELKSRVQVSLDPDVPDIKNIRVTVWWEDSNPGGEGQVVITSSKGRFW